MSGECTCGQKFRDAEDFRDHLPCGGTPERRRIRELENQLKLKQLELDAQVPALLEAVQENLRRALAAEKALTEARCARWGVWAIPNPENNPTSSGEPSRECWHKEAIVVAYDTLDEARAVGDALAERNDRWLAEPRTLPVEVRAVPAHLLAGRGR